MSAVECKICAAKVLFGNHTNKIVCSLYFYSHSFSSDHYHHTPICQLACFPTYELTPLFVSFP